MTPGSVYCAQYEGLLVLKYEGHIRLGESFKASAALDGLLDQLFSQHKVQKVLVDLTHAKSIDSTNLGLLARVARFSEEEVGHRATLICPENEILELLLNIAFDKVFVIIQDPEAPDDHLEPLGDVDELEHDFAKMVLNSHRALIALDAGNRKMFKDVVEAFEQELEGWEN